MRTNLKENKQTPMKRSKTGQRQNWMKRLNDKQTQPSMTRTRGTEHMNPQHNLRQRQRLT